MTLDLEGIQNMTNSFTKRLSKLRLLLADLGAALVTGDPIDDQVSEWNAIAVGMSVADYLVSERLVEEDNGQFSMTMAGVTFIHQLHIGGEEGMAEAVLDFCNIMVSGGREEEPQ